MYCIIFKKKLKKKPPSSGVFRNARWERCYPGSSDYRFAGDEVDRDPMYQYRIALAQTVRKNGRIKRKQWGLATLTYWDLVEDYLDAAKRAWVRQKDVWGVNEGRIFDGIHVHFPHATRAEYDAMVAMIHKKLSRIKTEVISHYKTTEEHQLQLERIKWERRRPADQTAGTSGDPKRTTASQARKNPAGEPDH